MFLDKTGCGSTEAGPPTPGTRTFLQGSTLLGHAVLRSDPGQDCVPSLRAALQDLCCLQLVHESL